MKEKTNRPDFSMYLAHFTKDGDFCNKEQDESIVHFSQLSAKDRLFSILNQQKIYPSNMPWTGLPCVCFTECPWSSLLAHTEQYSPYGIGFTKEFIFRNDGAPALYMRANIFAKIRNKLKMSREEKEMWTYVTPFSPEYGTPYTKRLLRKAVDYSHEREWRTPKVLSFDYSDVAFVILRCIDDYGTMPQEIRTSLIDANTKIIIMDNYRLIEDLWPVHKILLNNHR